MYWGSAELMSLVTGIWGFGLVWLVVYISTWLYDCFFSAFFCFSLTVAVFGGWTEFWGFFLRVY